MGGCWFALSRGGGPGVLMGKRPLSWVTHGSQGQSLFFSAKLDSSKGPSNYPPRHRGLLPSHRCVAGGGVETGAAGVVGNLMMLFRAKL